MNTFMIIKRLSTASRVPMTRIAKEAKISPQWLYKSLQSDPSFELMVSAIESCGYTLLIGKMVEGKPQEIKMVRYYEKD